MKTVRIQIKLSDELLQQLDEAAAARYVTRSQFLRDSIVLRIRGSKVIKQQQDEFLEKLKKLGDTV
jgi:metal-responsive CopG/Arc/MetJ family transcriptional regulator